MKVCPTGAITEDEKTKAKIINEDVCIGCRLCVIACPFGGVGFDPEKGKSIKCDFCQDAGEPQCVKWCPKEVLQLVDTERVGEVKRGLGIEKLQALAMKK
jgi:Fe-S-cluster-containing hydrogenase component 2